MSIYKPVRTAMNTAVLILLSGLGFEQWHVAQAVRAPSPECNGLPSVVGCRVDGHVELEAVEGPLNSLQDAAIGPGNVTVSPPVGRASLDGFAPTVQIRPHSPDTQALGTPSVLLASLS